MPSPPTVQSDVTVYNLCDAGRVSHSTRIIVMDICQCVRRSTTKDNRSDSEEDLSDSDFFVLPSCVCAIFRCVTTRMDTLSFGDSSNDKMWQKRTSDVSSTINTHPCSREDATWSIQSRHLHQNSSLIYSLSSKSFKAFTFHKWTLFLIVILLSPLLVFGSPPHRIRHRHQRHTVQSEQLCGKEETFARPASESCQHHPRVRRNINSMTLREGQETSLCPYRFCVDEDKNRTPIHIHRVYCLSTGCNCTDKGQYRCTQLYNNVEVWYGTNQTKSQPLTRGMLEVEFGCVCAAKHGTSVEAFIPDSVN